MAWLDVAKGVNPGMETWRNLIDGSKIVIEEPNSPPVGAVTAKLVRIEAELVSGPVAGDSDKPIRHPDLAPAKRFLYYLLRRIEVAEIMQIQPTHDDRVQKRDCRPRQSHVEYRLSIVFGKADAYLLLSGTQIPL
ncbi:hypothetical protein ABID25_002937 [Mesorhizobium abyssinicae]